VDTIDFTQQPKAFSIEARSIILATGYELTPTDAKAECGVGGLQNVVNALVICSSAVELV
jgi:heterodisulfide reductase subunit A-like polyferredoxin